MNGEAIQKIAELAELAASRVVEVDGQYCSARQLYTMRLPEAPPVQLHTLTGLVDYWKAEDLVDADAMLAIHVVTHDQVQIISHLSERTRQREYFAVAAFEPLLGQSFKFGAWYDSEHIVVALQTLFIATPKREELISLLGNIRSDASLEVEDDGATQSVLVRKGVALVKRASLGNPWPLHPWRTFREIEQPESPFVVRMKSDGDDSISVAIFEADGGAWKLEAIQRIAAYLREKLPDVKILA
jgi:hypothetical protein